MTNYGIFRIGTGYKILAITGSGISQLNPNCIKTFRSFVEADKWLNKSPIDPIIRVSLEGTKIGRFV